MLMTNAMNSANFGLTACLENRCLFSRFVSYGPPETFEWSGGYDWEELVHQMETCSTVEHLVQWCDTIDPKMPPLDLGYISNIRLTHDVEFVDGRTQIPMDIQVRWHFNPNYLSQMIAVSRNITTYFFHFKVRNPFLITTQGDGRCFLMAAARLLFGPICNIERRTSELRVRLVVEGLRNKDHYLSHLDMGMGIANYTCESSVPEMYAAFSGVEEEGLDAADTPLVYYATMLNYRKKFAEAGIWQFHQLANIVGAPVISIYPTVTATSEFMMQMRKLYHRVIYPEDPGRVLPHLAIMWIRSSDAVMSVNHFVSVVS